MVKERMDLLELLRKGRMDGDVDFLREALRVVVEGIMDAEVSARIGAEYGERSPERVTQRNGYRSRAWDTRSMRFHPTGRGHEDDEDGQEGWSTTANASLIGQTGDWLALQDLTMMLSSRLD